MERIPKNENTKERISLVEKQRQEAFAYVLASLDSRLPVELKQTFESNDQEYSLTSAEDCMVAFAQQNREVVEALYYEIKDSNNYRHEQAIAKLYALFVSYEKTVALYAELRSYYANVAYKVEEKLPPLSHIASHGEKQWQEMNR